MPRAERRETIELDLSKRGIKKLPKKITRLTNLKILDLSYNELTEVPGEIAQLKNLRILDLSYNKLTQVPREIARLRNLTQISLSNNKLKALPEEFAQLGNLTFLNLSFNQLAKVPKEITQLKNLMQLDLKNNQLRELPLEISELKKLIQLDLKNNKLMELPVKIAELKNLRQLNLNCNQLSRLPGNIAQLRNLTQLYLMKNRLTELPEEIAHLTNLQQLDLKNNLLIKLPRRISELKNLTFLNLSYNQLVEFPKQIFELKSLIYLYIGFNQLIELPGQIIHLKNLFYLDISFNLLTELPREIAELEKLKRLEVDDNPLTLPPVEIASQGLPAIVDYFKKMSKGGQTLYEGKLLILGQGGVGKTCLMRRLTMDKYSEGQITTEGIDIHPWEISAPDDFETQMILNVWDFGGQEIYHATHQFFLTQRSLYILVWDARQEEEYGRIDYWLKTIETFAEESPILLVMNKSDERIKHLNFNDLKQRCPQLVVSGRVSAKTGAGMVPLKNFIRKQAWKLPLMGTFWPPSWVSVRRTLETDTRYQMPYQEYLDRCTQYDIEENEARSLSHYLHDLGIILHFQDDDLLKKTIILKPEWGTDAVYKVLDSRVVQARNGILYNKDLPNIWKDPELYPRKKYATILRLMAKFELAFPIDRGDGHVVAELLPSREAEYDWHPPRDFLQFEYHYEFLPAGLITRLIVRMHDFLIQREGKHLCWREGAYFKYRGSQAMVRINPYDKIALIQIYGANKQELLMLIRSHFAALHKTIKKIRFKEKIPCICSPGCRYRFDYNFLLKCEEKGKMTQTCQISVEEVQVEQLLDNIEKSELRQKRLEEKMEDQYPSGAKPTNRILPPKVKKWYLRKLW
ncbi:COR domain-containing protein [Desulfonema magnum]|uniref:COR domain-containing protein n=1 Tax=Desulfonema magnum TaxID=45655 RepID=UPI001A9A8F4C|nr:COR domain-containing protein [Desulfonema magnum]